MLLLTNWPPYWTLMQLHEIIFRTKQQAPTDPDNLVKYGHKSDHRDKTGGKAQWTVSELEERNVFKLAMSNQWKERKFAWSIHRPAGSVAMLGVDRDHTTQVFIAKFDEHEPSAWHGYPCNYKAPQQRPPSSILHDWLNQGILSAAKIRKITSGQRCAI